MTGYEPVGRGFESLRAYQIRTAIMIRQVSRLRFFFYSPKVAWHKALRAFVSSVKCHREHIRLFADRLFRPAIVSPERFRSHNDTFQRQKCHCGEKSVIVTWKSVIVRKRLYSIPVWGAIEPFAFMRIFDLCSFSSFPLLPQNHLRI